MRNFYFLKDLHGYLTDEVTSKEADEFLSQGRFIETIKADSRDEAYELAEKRNCEHAHWYAGNPCTCGSHNF